MNHTEFASHSEVVEALKAGRPLLDVRAPVEFQKGSLPGAVNLPILNDQERHDIGTCYKKKGPEAAVRLGEELVSGSVKDERIAGWVDFFRKNPDSFLYCFRGGQRSAYTQRWLGEAGVKRPRIQGGYKQYRQFLIENLEAVSKPDAFVILSGKTGSGKTELLRSLDSSFSVCDLERHANHRGSAFGRELTPQPSQVDFENRVSVDLLRLKDRGQTIILEDESRMIGRMVIPEVLFQPMREARVVVIDESVNQRARRIFQEYVTATYTQVQDKEKLKALLTDPLMRIQKKLGGARTQEALNLLNSAFDQADFLSESAHLPWIEFLLVHYYDPMYEYGLEKKAHRTVYSGDREAALAYLRKL